MNNLDYVKTQQERVLNLDYTALAKDTGLPAADLRSLYQALGKLPPEMLDPGYSVVMGLLEGEVGRVVYQIALLNKEFSPRSDISDFMTRYGVNSQDRVWAEEKLKVVPKSDERHAYYTALVENFRSTEADPHFQDKLQGYGAAYEELYKGGYLRPRRIPAPLFVFLEPFCRKSVTKEVRTRAYRVAGALNRMSERVPYTTERAPRYVAEELARVLPSY